MYWIEFIFSAAVIVFAGIRLTFYADKLSDHLKIGKVWVGIILLGLVTSLPEAITSLIAVISLGANDLAIGNLLGSNNFNPMLIVVLDALFKGGSITSLLNPNKSQVTSAYLAIALSCVVIAELALSPGIVSGHNGTVSLGGILIVVLYFGGMKKLAALSTEVIGEPSKKENSRETKTSLSKILINLVYSSLLVVVGAIYLTHSCEIIAVKTGLGRTFVGSIFLAFATSLPEIVVSVSAFKMNELDLAIGNIFGSNMTNIFIVFICGLFNQGVPILSVVSKTHIFTGILGIILTYLALRVICDKNQKVICGLGVNTIVMIVVFVVGTGIMYQLR